MKKLLIAVAMLAGVCGTAHAANAGACANKDACAKPLCGRLDNAGFCVVDPTRLHRPPTLTRVSLNDQGRMQLDRLIARLR